MNAYDTIAHLHPCVEAADWLKTQPDTQTAWSTCHRGDWMMWLVSKVIVDQHINVTLACRFARMVLGHITNGDNRPLAAIEAAEAWLANPCEETRAAADAAYAAAGASAAACAARAAADAADAAAAAARAAVAVAVAVADAEQANIIRGVIPVCPFVISY